MNILEYENYQEIKSHFEIDFSYNTYLCTIPLDFFSVPMHWHSEMELIYVKKGRGMVSVDLTEYLVTAGNIVVIMPGQLHAISAYQNESFEYENIIFNVQMLIPKQNDTLSEEFFNSLLGQKIQFPVLINETITYYHQILHCINRADEICTHFPSGYYLGIRSCLYEFFYILFSNSTECNIHHKASRALDKIKLITKYIEEHFEDEITIEKMAEICNFSQSHFMKFFKASMGTAFFSYLNDYRLTTASYMLTKSMSSIFAIAQECGFNNLSYFNRLFKKKFGMTPSDFRNHV